MNFEGGHDDGNNQNDLQFENIYEEEEYEGDHDNSPAKKRPRHEEEEKIEEEEEKNEEEHKNEEEEEKQADDGVGPVANIFLPQQTPAPRTLLICEIFLPNLAMMIFKTT